MSKTTLLLVLGLVAAGCHAAPCGGCADWETCNAATDECVLNAGTRFDLVADDGDVPGDSWDAAIDSVDCEDLTKKRLSFDQIHKRSQS